MASKEPRPATVIDHTVILRPESRVLREIERMLFEARQSERNE